METVWSIDEAEPAPRRRRTARRRERVLPTGAMHLAVRLSGGPLRLLAGASDADGDAVGYAVVGGARAAPYLREVSGPARSVGAQLRPGACTPLFGVPADELAGGHIRLDDVWGAAGHELRERLLEAGSPERRLHVFEAFLDARLPRVHGLHPAVAHALDRFAGTVGVGAVVRETGYSHRRFVTLFRGTVGLTPKRYCRVVRFGHALERVAAAGPVASLERVAAAGPVPSLARLALEAGYSDQSHLNRDFREFAGITPGAYRAARPVSPHHVPIRGSAV